MSDAPERLLLELRQGMTFDAWSECRDPRYARSEPVEYIRADKAEAERDRLRAALDDALVACRIVDAVARAGHEKIGDLVLHMLSAVEPARAALKGDSDE